MIRLSKARLQELPTARLLALYKKQRYFPHTEAGEEYHIDDKSYLDLIRSVLNTREHVTRGM